MRSAILAATIVLAGCATVQPTGRPLPAVTGFDVDRYQGEWLEIASIPAWFQQDCVADTRAVYAPASDNEGWIAVANSCRTASGATKVVEGRARFTGSSDTGALEVTFASLLGSWVWPAAGAYVVIALDPDYGWAVVGHPSREYGWILARQPSLDAATMAKIREVLTASGYDPCRLTRRGAGSDRSICES